MLADRLSCTGCGSCQATCPNKCIVMVEDVEGFLYPEVNQDKCLNCKKCRLHCPVLHAKKVDNTPNALAVKNIKNSIRQSSSSGGVFTALAEYIINKGGVVCAAIYDDKFSVVHAIIDDCKKLNQMRGAKYAQSDVKDCFKMIKNYLRQRQYVLFVGTPCQVAGLLSFLGQDYEQLILIDMVCHGVPSPKVWQKYLQERRDNDVAGIGISNINFRSKKTGWSHYRYSVEIIYQNGDCYFVPQEKDAYMEGFVSDWFLRLSCYNCQFKGKHRVSDFTIGDYWGIWDQYPEFDDNKGTSLVLIHTKKGRETWERISDQFEVLKVSVDEALQSNPSALQSAKLTKNRSFFFKGLSKGEQVSELVRKCKKMSNRTSFIRLRKLFKSI